jgi:hypothetical protein
VEEELVEVRRRALRIPLRPSQAKAAVKVMERGEREIALAKTALAETALAETMPVTQTQTL